MGSCALFDTWYTTCQQAFSLDVIIWKKAGGFEMAREIVVLSGVRTAIGGYGGSLKDTPPSELAATCVREAVKRSGVDPGDVGHVVFGNIIQV